MKGRMERKRPYSAFNIYDRFPKDSWDTYESHNFMYGPDPSGVV
jgi:hypothetical protein